MKQIWPRVMVERHFHIVMQIAEDQNVRNKGWRGSKVDLTERRTITKGTKGPRLVIHVNNKRN